MTLKVERVVNGGVRGKERTLLPCSTLRPLEPVQSRHPFLARSATISDYQLAFF